MDDRVLLDAVPDAVLVVDRGRVTWCNAATTRMLGASAAGRTLEELFESGDARRFALSEAQRAAGWNLAAGVRVGLRRPGKAPAIVDVHAAALPDGTSILCARDLTQATRAESLMGKLALLSSDSPLLDGPDALLDASEPVFLAFGWTAAFTEVVGEHSIVRRVLSPEGNPVGAYARGLLGQRLPFERTALVAEVVRTRRAHYYDNIPGLLDEGRAAQLTDSMLKARVARSAWCPVLRDDVVTHVLAVTGPDLTEHDFVALRLFAAELGASLRLGELRRELVRRERLAALGEMAAVLAHEVRNPLGAIFAAVATLRRHRVPRDAEPERTRLLDILAEEATRLRRVAADLLTFAHPTPPALEEVELLPLVDNALDLARHDAAYAERAPKVSVDVPPGAGHVLADPDLLTRALANLLTNAFQHVTPGGAVSVVGRAAGEGHAELRVRNEGSALPVELAEKVFEPFYTTKATGTGLGLAIVRRIAADLGGRVATESDTGGVTFVLVLRRA